MAQKYKIRNLLKNLPFYSEKIKSSKTITKNLVISSFYLNYHFSIKKPKELTNKQPSEALPVPPKLSKRPKRLTKHQILQNILPFYDSVGISKKERAFRGYAETWSYAET